MSIFYKPIDHDLPFYDRMVLMKSLKFYSGFVKSGIYIKLFHLVHFIRDNSVILMGFLQ